MSIESLASKERIYYADTNLQSFNLSACSIMKAPRASLEFASKAISKQAHLNIRYSPASNRGAPTPTGCNGGKRGRGSSLIESVPGHELAMGSMPQFLSAVANSLPSIMPTSQKVIADRNVQNVVLGDIFFKTWYPSFYPEELVGRDTERLYVCRWCFKYSKEVMPFSAHVVTKLNRVLRAFELC